MSRNLDNWINAYLNYTQDSEAPRVFHWWAAASTIASVLQGKVWIDMGDFVWKPNFYIIFVAPPGVANKSTTLNIARRFSSEMVDEKGNPSMAYGPDSGTWQGLMDALVDVSQQYTIGGETTYMSAITSVISELGTFLRSDDFEKIDTLVNLWDNPPKFTTRTRGGGLVQVTNPCLNIIGATTPDWVRKNFPEYGMFGGFTSRVMFIHAAAKSRLIAYPGMGKRKEGYTLRKKLLDDLQKIHRLQGEYVITKEGLAWGVDWYQKHHEDPRELQIAEGYHARKQSHIHKLAIILSAAESDNLFITEEHLTKAEAIITNNELSMQEVFNYITGTDESQRIERVITLMEQKQQASQRNLWNILRRSMGFNDFLRAMQGACATGSVDYRKSKNEIIYFIVRSETID